MNLLSLIPRFRKAQRAMDALERREHWSRQEIEAFHLERVNELWRSASRHVPYYRRLAQELRLPPRFASLEDFKSLMPVLPKAPVRADRRTFLSDRAAPGVWHSSSGSTGVPMRFFWAA